MIRSKHHPKKPMNHTIRIRVTRRRWTPEDIEMGDTNDLGECWDELFETEEEADAYLWDRFATSYGDALDRLQRYGPWSADAAVRYTDDGDEVVTIEGAGVIEWSALIVS